MSLIFYMGFAPRVTNIDFSGWAQSCSIDHELCSIHAYGPQTASSASSFLAMRPSSMTAPRGKVADGVTPALTHMPL